MTNNAKQGGLAVGKSHANGGIKGTISDTSAPIEIEGGEAVINKHSMADQSTVSVTGTPKEIASCLNEKDGNGVNFRGSNDACQMEVINAPAPVNPHQMGEGGMPVQTAPMVEVFSIWDIIFWSIEKPI